MKRPYCEDTPNICRRAWRNQPGADQETSFLLICFHSTGRWSQLSREEKSSTVLPICEPRELKWLTWQEVSTEAIVSWVCHECHVCVRSVMSVSWVSWCVHAGNNVTSAMEGNHSLSDCISTWIQMRKYMLSKGNLAKNLWLNSSQDLEENILLIFC